MAGKTFPGGGEWDASSWRLASPWLSSFRLYVLVVVVVVVVVAMSYTYKDERWQKIVEKSRTDRCVLRCIYSCTIGNWLTPVSPSRSNFPRGPRGSSGLQWRTVEELTRILSIAWLG
jgi:hypothetical protein